MTLDINDKISVLVEDQFPAIYREDGPTMVAFMQAYYEFLETDPDMAVYRSRELLSYRDIDETLDAFIKKFTFTYLNGFPQITATDKRFMIKHIMDFYRSKGSKQSLQLFLRLVYGVDSDIYYPGEDVLQVSNSLWYLPIYVELDKISGIENLLDKQVFGSISGSSAFVEGIVTKRTKSGRFVNVMYLSKVKGTFLNGELISDGTDFTNAPKITGSLSDITILNGGSGNEVGDIYEVLSEFGSFGKVRVSEIDESTVQGIINFAISEGGFGYTVDANTQVLVSDIRLIAEVGNTNTIEIQPLDIVKQHLETIEVVELVSENFITVGRPIEITGIANGLVAQLVSNSEMTINVTEGSFLNANAGANIIYNVDGSNTIPFTLANTAVDASANATLVGSNSITLGITDNTAPFIIWPVNGSVETVVTNGTLPAPAIDGLYYPQVLVIDQNNGSNVVINTVSISSADLSSSFNIGSINYQETITVRDETIEDYANVTLDSANYGFANNGDISSTLDSVLVESTQTIGQITSIVGVNPGVGYTSNPFIYVINPNVAAFWKQDELLVIDFPTRSFANNEVVRMETSANTTAYGQVTFANNSHVYLQRFSFEVDFEETGTLIGLESTAQATVTQRWVLYDNLRAMGNNALVVGTTRSTNGVIRAVQIINSGYGYIDQENITLNTGNTLNSVIGIANVSQQGIGEGYWKTRNSHTNSEKKIHDNQYYQEYSYDVRTGIALSKYREALLSLVHVAGTILFGSVVKDSCVGSISTICGSYIDVGASANDFINDATDLFITNMNQYVVLDTANADVEIQVPSVISYALYDTSTEIQVPSVTSYALKDSSTEMHVSSFEIYVLASNTTP